MTSTEVVVTAVTAVVMVVGVAGTVLPVLPGLTLIWGTMLVYGLILGFGWAGWIAMVVATLLGALGLYLSFRIPQRSASGTGLSIGAQLIAAAVAVAGFFAFPPFGAAFGFVAAVYVMRWKATGDGAAAWLSTRSIVAALIRASAAQVACAVAMLAAWLGWAATVVFG